MQNIISSENPIVFVSKTQLLDVIIEPEKKQIVAGSNDIDVQPARHARFRGFQYTTDQEENAAMMISRLVRNRRMGIVPSFWIHPGHLDQGRALCAKYYPDLIADDILNIKKQEAVADAEFTVQQTNEELRQQVANLTAAVAALTAAPAAAPKRSRAKKEVLEEKTDSVDSEDNEPAPQSEEDAA